MGIRHAIGVRSDFSIGESILSAKKFAGLAKELGYESAALVDTMTVSGMVAFSKELTKVGIKPIIGCSIWVFDDPTYRKPSKASGERPKKNLSYRLKVFVQNEEGMRSLLALLSRGYSEDYFYYHARVGIEDVLKLKGCVVTTGDIYSLFHHPRHQEILTQLEGALGRDKTLVELVPIDTPLYDTLNKKGLLVARLMGLDKVCSLPVFYQSGDDQSLDVLRAITSQMKIDHPAVMIPYMRDFYPKSTSDLFKQMHQTCLRIGLPAEEANAVTASCFNSLIKLEKSCTYQFAKSAPCLPKMSENEFGTLMQHVKEGWNVRFKGTVLGHQPSAEEMPIYKERLAYELGVLRSMGFSGYFLLVQDIVNWCKKNEIIVGPGRGSVGGSLVAYLLGITDVDPIRFNLIFERFINPDRIDLPDADLDFQSSRRTEVIDYIVKKYGRDRVAGISNYSTLGPSSAIRDVSRTYNLDPLAYSCSKLVEKEHGVPMPLKDSVTSVPEIEKFSKSFPQVWKHATTLEGVMRGLGQHAAGVVVAGEPLINRSVVETRKEGTPVINWDKSSCEDWGLIKLDVLGLTTLDVLEAARRYIRERHKKNINLLALPLDDDKVLENFGKGNTVGVFQFEGHGMRKLLRSLREGGKLTFDDCVATTALFRPGPLDAGLCDDYVAIKQGKKAPYYEHSNMVDALKTTYGVIVYQEQVMQVARDLAGFTMTESDHLRKAMGKKDKEKMAEMREKWVAGCKSKSDMDPIHANILFDKIEGFAAYAFNLSHSVEYTIISYWAMWLKTYYPAEFYAASMSIQDDADKLGVLVMDAKQNGITVSPPDINISTNRVEIADDKTLTAPFQAIKGISTNVANYIVQCRAKTGAFKSKEHFEASLKEQGLAGKVNISHRTKLDKVGAFFGVDGGVTPHDPIRLRDRLELMPGYTIDTVKASRAIDLVVVKTGLLRMLEEVRACEKCSLKDAGHVLPRVGKSPKFMVVLDSPSWVEEKKGKLLEGETGDIVKAAFSDAGLELTNAYVTALVRAPKGRGVKTLSNDQVIQCSEYLRREVEILKPPVILVLGSAAARYFTPEVKGTMADLAGKVIFDPKLDASIVFGVNPAQVLFNSSLVSSLLSACMKVKSLIV